MRSFARLGGLGNVPCVDGGTLALAVAWGILLAGIVSPLPASADSGSNCAKLRADIIDMDARSSTLPGYLDLRANYGRALCPAVRPSHGRCRC